MEESKNMNWLIISGLVLMLSLLGLSGLAHGQTKKAYSYPQVATGQTKLYDKDGDVVESLKAGDSCYGQDANYLQGAAMSYTDNGDGTVTDNNTGLMWQKIPTSEEFSWKEAIKYCNKLKLGGHSDWRMPTLKELFSVSDFSSGWPYIDTDYFALASGTITKDEQYWANNYYVGATSEGGYKAAFGVNHVTGHIKAYPAEKPSGAMQGGPRDGRPQGDALRGPRGSGPNGRPNGAPNGMQGNMPPPPQNGGKGQMGGRPKGNPMEKYVRAVRGDAYGENDFADNGDGTVTDKASGLMWAQADGGQGMDWEAALKYAENATVGGYSDWRLPNVKELQGIVDYSYSITAKKSKKQKPAIDPIFSCTEVKNELGEKDYPYYWTSTSARFNKEGSMSMRGMSLLDMLSMDKVKIHMVLVPYASIRSMRVVN